jgi:glycosyltransferase involved in cell wall biosynthesis
MKVLLVNSFDRSGGAAVACNRLLQALHKEGVDVKLLAQEQTKPDPLVVPVGEAGKANKTAFGRFLLDRLEVYFQEKDKSARFAFSPAHIGTDISKHPAVLEADIIHLHWVYFGFLSIESLRKLMQLGKPIVWTLHDMWPFTGGCHYSGECTHYLTHCHACPFLKRPSAKDLSYKVFQQKIELFQRGQVHFVGCSQWLADTAKESALLKSFPITAIPNPINTEKYSAKNKIAARRQTKLPEGKELILFGAMNTKDSRKGFAYLKDALQLLKGTFPKTADDVELVIFGKSDPDMLADLPFPVNNRGRIDNESELVYLYNACDVTVLPSVQDNLPNTVMESMACATPVVAFNTSGLPEMVDHGRNGYLAQHRSADDLAQGIYQILYQSNTQRLQEQARQKVLDNYSETKVAGQYIDVYKSLLR